MMRGVGLVGAARAARPAWASCCGSPIRSRHDMHGLPGVIAGVAASCWPRSPASGPASTTTAAPPSPSASARSRTLLIARLRDHRPSTRARDRAGCSSCSAASPSWSPPSLLVALPPQRRRALRRRRVRRRPSAPSPPSRAILTEAVRHRDRRRLRRRRHRRSSLSCPASPPASPGCPSATPPRRSRPPTAAPTDDRHRGDRRARSTPSRIAAQARRGHELLLGLVGGCAAVVVGAARGARLLRQRLGPAARAGRGPGDAAARPALPLHRAGRLRPRRGPRHRSACWSSAWPSTRRPTLVKQLAPDGDRGPLDIRTVWLAAAVAVGAALITAIGLIVPRKGVSPFWGRLLDLAEGAVLLSPRCRCAWPSWTCTRRPAA